jgi:hypothetical protein
VLIHHIYHITNEDPQLVKYFKNRGTHKVRIVGRGRIFDVDAAHVVGKQSAVAEKLGPAEVHLAQIALMAGWLEGNEDVDQLAEQEGFRLWWLLVKGPLDDLAMRFVHSKTK